MRLHNVAHAPSVIGGFLTQRASYEGNASIWWCRHALLLSNHPSMTIVTVIGILYSIWVSNSNRNLLSLVLHIMFQVIASVSNYVSDIL